MEYGERRLIKIKMRKEPKDNKFHKGAKDGKHLMLLQD